MFVRSKLVQNIDEATKVLIRAFNDGDIQAAYQLGALYRKKGDIKESVKWFNLASIRADWAKLEHDKREKELMMRDKVFHWFPEINIRNVASYLPRPPPINDTPTNIEAEQCTICLNNKKRIAFGCGHICSCNECSLRLEKCPLCRAEINVRNPVYI